jgi:signal transduction histidine kinase
MGIMGNDQRMVKDRYAERLDEKGRDFLTRVTRGAQRMNLLLDDILLLSRAQRLEMATEEIDAGEVVSEVLHRLERKIAETRANVTLSADLPKLRVDKTWATQAFYNLVGNALKFTRHGEPPSIEIAAYDLNGSQAQEVGIAVRDRGPGVPTEQSERIFKLFQRAVGREVEGTGAGLAIVRQIAERHGGRVWVQERPGGGSEFVITFARADPQERT